MRRNGKASPPRAPRSEALDRFSPLLDPEPSVPKPVAFIVKVRVWRYQGKSSWHFANLPKAESAEIRSSFAASRRGWGSIPVSVRVGETEWETSLFPDRKTSSYLFAIKASVRQVEGIADGDLITASLSVRVLGKARR